MFDNLVIAYLFCGGTGAGLLVVLGVLGLVRMWRAVSALHGSFFSRAWVVCLGVLLLSIALLVADLGRPERAPFILEQPHLTAITFGTVFLGMSCIVVFLLLVLLYVPRNSFSSRGRRHAVEFLLVAGIVCGLCVAGYTGVLLWGMPSVLAWQTPLVPLLFVCSSLSCGIAAVLALLASFDGRPSFLQSRAFLSRRLMRVDSCLVAAELVLLACYLVWCASDAPTRASAELLATGDFAARFWCGLVAFGLVAPLVLELLCPSSERRLAPGLLVVVCLCVLVGGVFLRWCIVGVSVSDISQVAAAMSSYIPQQPSLLQ